MSEARSTSADERAVDERESKDAKLAHFRNANDRPKKMPKADRERMIREQFPSVDNLNWENAFHNDIDLFARIMRDIIKLDQREPGKAGPRPNNMDYEKGVASFRQLMGQDYSTLPFHESFALLARGNSLTQVARKANLSRSRAHRLLQGVDRPTQEDMRLVAEAYNKHPSFFVEYRRTFIIEQLADRLLNTPEITISYYSKLSKAD